mmetsp:Transcript_16451/g.28188  ORF Transcript_16451/g.28188 Transcript_16451/m.28188 type:complete len:257 (-) Transcript_16451:1837-2607(-)
MLDVRRDEEVCCLEVVGHGHATGATWHADVTALLLLLLGWKGVGIGGCSGFGAGNDEDVLLLDSSVILVALSGIDRLTDIAVDYGTTFSVSALASGCVLFITTFLLALSHTISSRHTMTMTIPEIPLGYRDLAMQAIAKLDAGLTACRIATHELISVFNAIRNHKVGSLEVVIDRHATCPTGHNGCSTGSSSELLVEVLFSGGIGKGSQCRHETILEALIERSSLVKTLVQALVEARRKFGCAKCQSSIGEVRISK